MCCPTIQTHFHLIYTNEVGRLVNNRATWSSQCAFEPLRTPPPAALFPKRFRLTKPNWAVRIMLWLPKYTIVVIFFLSCILYSNNFPMYRVLCAFVNRRPPLHPLVHWSMGSRSWENRGPSADSTSISSQFFHCQFKLRPLPSSPLPPPPPRRRNRKKKKNLLQFFFFFY